jgi:DNA-binding MarR family transcriptional regulator
VQDQTTIRLRQLITRMARQLNRASTDEGLSPAQASVLGVVASRGPIGMSRLAEVDRIHPSVLSRTVASLQRAGLVARIQDTADLRSTLVGVTKSGKAVHAQIISNRSQVIATAAKVLTSEQQRSIDEALTALEVLVEELRRSDPDN